MKRTKAGTESRRITRKDAEELYPDAWVVFAEPRIGKDHTFKDGVVYFHTKDQVEAYSKSAEISGDCAVYYTGEIPYRRMELKEDEGNKAAA